MKYKSSCREHPQTEEENISKMGRALRGAHLWTWMAGTHMYSQQLSKSKLHHRGQWVLRLHFYLRRYWELIVVEEGHSSLFFLFTGRSQIPQEMTLHLWPCRAALIELSELEKEGVRSWSLEEDVLRSIVQSGKWVQGCMNMSKKCCMHMYEFSKA